MKIFHEGNLGNSVSDNSDSDDIQSDEYLLALAQEARAQQSETVDKSIEKNSNRLRIVEAVAGVTAVFAAGLVFERLNYRHAH